MPSDVTFLSVASTAVATTATFALVTRADSLFSDPLASVCSEAMSGDKVKLPVNKPTVKKARSVKTAPVNKPTALSKAERAVYMRELLRKRERAKHS